MPSIKICVKHYGLVLAGAVAMSLLASPANAGTGCNGVVNWTVWGCAGWDNNNGAKFPYYHKKVVSIKIPKGTHVEVKDGHAVATVNGEKLPVVGGVAALKASGIVSGGAGNIVSGGAGNIVSGGAGNLQVYSGK